MKSKSLALTTLAAAALFSASPSFAEPTEATPVPPASPDYRVYPGFRPGKQGYEGRNRGESQRAITNAGAMSPARARITASIVETVCLRNIAAGNT